MPRPTSLIYDFSPFRLDPAERVLLRDGELVPLTPKAFETLLALVERGGHVVTKEELMQIVWPDTFVEEVNLAKNISELRKILSGGDPAREFIATIPKRGYRFIAPVRQSFGEGAKVSGRVQSADVITSGEELEPVGGAVPLDSRFYVVRPVDEAFRAAIARRDSIVLLKGARQVGKTSLLARGMDGSRGAGVRVVLTDFQMLNASDLASIETLFLALADLIADQLELDISPRAVWDPLHSPNLNFERFWRRHVLGHTTGAVVWGMDEVDRLFAHSFASEVFGLFRSWHNARSLDPRGPWQRLTLAMAYATEAHLFITDMNQSPFNVGTRLLLEDFTPDQTAELNRRYGSPLREEDEVEHYSRLVGGNPYLVRRGLHEMTARRITLVELEAQAASDEGPFGDHLRRMLASLAQDQALCEVARGVVRGEPHPTAESFYRLRSAGVMAGETPRDMKPRCQLYAVYLEQHLL